MSRDFQLSKHPFIRGELTWLVLFWLDLLLLSPCARVCVTALFPEESNVICCSLCHSLSLSPSGLLPSLVQEGEWHDSDVMGLHRLSRWIAILGDTHTHARARAHTQNGSVSQTYRHSHTCMHSPIFTHKKSHTCMAIQSQTLLHAHTRPVS